MLRDNRRRGPSAPFNFLVGKDGKMAARHVRGDELETRVLELPK
jgi:hypothetical protein